MNKQEYIKQLKIRLKRLPKEDFARAIEYYEEYFADAGEENEAKAIKDLGSPQEAADQIIRDTALNYSKEPVKDVRRGMNGIWVALLALFAVPIALPLLLTGVVLVIVAMVVVWILLLALMMVAVAVVITGPFSILAGFTVITKSIPVFLSCTGLGLFSIGIGTALAYGTYRLCKGFLGWTLQRLAGMIRKEGKKNVSK